MRNVILATMILIGALTAEADVYVNGYYKSNGTYVKPHYRTSPDRYKYNNYSYQKKPYRYNNYGY